MFISEYMKTMS